MGKLSWRNIIYRRIRNILNLKEITNKDILKIKKLAIAFGKKGFQNNENNNEEIVLAAENAKTPQELDKLENKAIKEKIPRVMLESAILLTMLTSKLSITTVFTSCLAIIFSAILAYQLVLFLKKKT